MTCYVCQDCARPSEQFCCGDRAIELTDKQYECWATDTSLDASDAAYMTVSGCDDFLKLKQGEEA